MHDAKGRRDPAVPYRGSDRRGRVHRGRRSIRRADIAALLVALVVGAGLLPLGLRAMPAPAAQHAQDALRMIWSATFLVAGVLHVVRWRVTGETRTGIRGAGAIALGALILPGGAIAPLLSSSVTTAELSPLTRTVAVVACLSLLSRAVHAPAVDTRARPLRALAVTVLGGWAFVVALVLMTSSGRALHIPNAGWFRLELALAFGWLLCSAAAAARAGREHNSSFAWLAIATALMAAAELLRGAAFVVDPRLQFVSTGTQLVVAALVLVNAATDLSVLLSAESGLLHLLSGTVRDAERHLSDDERAESARRHDARAVLASLRAASLVLDRYDETLDHETRTELLGSFTNELARLEQMIERRTPVPLESFRLDDVLAPALAGVQGVTIASALSPMQVQGRPQEFAALVQTVVTTLGRRAVDARVAVRIGRSTSGVQVVCEATCPRKGADGPLEADGDDAARSLRLQVARRMMREQAGDVVVHERRDGSTSVALWLRPAPEPAPATAPETPPASEPAALPQPRRAVPRAIRQVS